MSMEGKVALVTGASRGLGRAILEELRIQGCKVFFTWVSSEDQAKMLCDIHGEHVACMRADASNYDKAGDVVSAALERFSKLDVLINNAGIAKHKSLLNISFDDFDYSIRGTLYPVFNYTKAILPHFVKRGGGKIVNIGSINGLRGREGSAPYCAGKAGITGFSKTVAKEMGKHHITCNVVAPGYIDTDGQQNTSELIKKLVLDESCIRKLATPQQIAKLVVFLSSTDADAITGQVYQMDYGQYV